MTAEQLSRSAVLAYRAHAHDLEHPAATPAECGVLETGVQDRPPGTTARQALAARLATPQEEDPTLNRSLALVHSLRGAMHVHPVRDLGLLAAALRPDDPADRDAVDQVATAMAQVIGGIQTLTKNELSTQITQLLPPRLRPWCPGCQVEHVPDGLFRMATLPAGLRLRPTGNRSATFFRTGAPNPSQPERARRELLRRFLRRCGPAVTKDLAAWAGIMPPAAKTWWDLLADELVEVRVDGKLLWMHTDDLSAAHEADMPTTVRLLPPYDPLAEVANRELLLPDPTHRRQVWRAVANPGLVLIAGELAGTWRRRDKVLTVAPFTSLSTGQQQAIQTEARSGDMSPVADVTFNN
jgi:Winged helix DNA-binding domain